MSTYVHARRRARTTSHATRNTMLVVAAVSAIAALAVVEVIPRPSASRAVPVSEATTQPTTPAVLAGPEAACTPAGVRVIYKGYGEACATQG